MLWLWLISSEVLGGILLWPSGLSGRPPDPLPPVRPPVVWSRGCESRDRESRDACEAGSAMASRNLLAVTEFQV